MKLKIIIILILGLVVGFTGWRLMQIFSNQDSAKQSTEPKLLPSINGNLVTEDKAKLRPIALVVENHADARPQSGLTDAEIIYETLAEGGITRFLAIFQTREPKEIGPIRSARPYFNFLANMWHAPLVHSGGSKQALSELSAGVHKNLFDVNEFYYGDYFSRDKTRTAPHNLYTTLEQQRKLLDKKSQTDWTPMQLWQTQTTPTDQLVTEVTKITLPFSPGNYIGQFTFDPTTSTYQRTSGTKQAIDRNNQTSLSPRNVLVMLADISPIIDDELGTQNIKLNNNGPCYLFRAGKYQQCKWEFRNDQHYYTDMEGNPLTLEPGQTWIAIFPRDRQNEIKWQ